MTYLSWRRSCVLSAIDELVATSDAQPFPGSDGGRPFNAMVRSLTAKMPIEEIVATTSDLLTSHPELCRDGRGPVLKAMAVGLSAGMERLEVERRLKLDRALIERNALCCDDDRLLVWDRSRSASLEEQSLDTLMARYPCAGPGARWNQACFLALLEARLLQCRRTAIALEIRSEDPLTRPCAATVVLVVPQDRRTTFWFAPVTLPLPATAVRAARATEAWRDGPTCLLPG